MRLVDAYYSESFEKSYATVEHSINGIKQRFEGISKVHPEEEHASKFTGCRYAEMRARIKAYKAERAALIIKCDECRKFIKACGQCKDWDKNSATAKVAYRQLNKKINHINHLTNVINQLEWDLKIAIRQQETVSKKLADKRAMTAFVDEACPEDIKAEVDNSF